ncbi:MAG TPA: DUF2149 domain-containing protein [Solirubrobacteraceae bacterium]|nr:DUF2149 domain-containing protein [Solirubrobacteraceae bacterium]
MSRGATRRSGLGRYAQIDDVAGDPLDGLVNLFDIGIVLAVAFLVAGLGAALDEHGRALRARAAAPASTQRTGTLPSSTQAPAASGRGRAVGTVYRLADGQLVYVVKPGH